MTGPVEIILDPHVRNAIQAIGIALILLIAIVFEEFVSRQAEKR